MAPPKASNSPVAFVADRISQILKRLLHFQKSVWQRILGWLNTLRTLIKNLAKQIKQLIQIVGKKAVDMLLRVLQRLQALINPITKLLAKLIQTAKRVLTIIRKKTDMTEVIRILKTVIRGFVTDLRQLFARVTSFLSEIDILGKALALFDRFRSVLRMAFRWIDDLTRLAGTVQKIRLMLRSTLKILKKEVTEAIRMGKDMARLKVPG